MQDILIVGLILIGLVMMWIGARGIYWSYQGLRELRKAEQTMRALRELWFKDGAEE